MRRIAQLIPSESYDGAFFRAILAVHSEKQKEAQKWIDTARSALHPQFSSLGVLASESYSRAHSPLVKAQQLAELEELMDYSNYQAGRHHEMSSRLHHEVAAQTRMSGASGATIAQVPVTTHPLPSSPHTSPPSTRRSPLAARRSQPFWSGDPHTPLPSSVAGAKLAR